LSLSQRLKIASFDVAEQLLGQADAIGRMLRALVRSLQTSEGR